MNMTREELMDASAERRERGDKLHASTEAYMQYEEDASLAREQDASLARLAMYTPKVMVKPEPKVDPWLLNGMPGGPPDPWLPPASVARSLAREQRASLALLAMYTPKVMKHEQMEAKEIKVEPVEIKVEPVESMDARIERGMRFERFE